jgi:hypothetical protein
LSPTTTLVTGRTNITTMSFSELFDETLDINSTGNYILSIQANLDGFYFCLLDSLRNKFVLFRSYEPDEDGKFTVEDIKKICSDDDFLMRSYAGVKTIVPSPRSTLIPSQLYNPSGKDDYFEFNHFTHDGETIRANRLIHPDAFLLYSADNELIDFLSERFGGTEPAHHLKPLLYQILSGKEASAGSRLHLHVERDFINVIHISEGNLILCNTYPYRNTSDLMYYLLYVAKKAGLHGNSTLYVSGTTVRFDEIWSGLSEYIRNIKYGIPEGKFLFSYLFNEELLHRHFNLFSIVSCA